MLAEKPPAPRRAPVPPPAVGPLTLNEFEPLAKRKMTHMAYEYVAGGDTSDVYHRGYAGGLCAAAVTGRRAGAAVAHSTTAAPSAA